MTPNIYPVARYTRAREAITWLCRTFGFEEHGVYPGPDDTVAHAELRFGTGTLGISSAGPVNPANVWTTVREGIYVSVGDPDAHHARAAAAGAVIERALANTDYGSREYSARDPEGHLWSFGTYAMTDRTGPPVFYPSLRYEHGAAAVSFLTRAFGFDAGLQVPGEAGDVHHAELWMGSGVLMVGAGPDPDACWAGRRQGTCVLVEDPDAHHARAAESGARIVQAPATSEYGARSYVAQDLEGFLWSFSTYQPARPSPPA